MADHAFGLKTAAVVAGLAWLAALSATATAKGSEGAGGWTHVGGDPGMSKYCPQNIAGEVRQVYVKRFCGAWSDKPPQPNYHYASAVVIRNGTAAAFTNDVQKDYEIWSDGVTLVLFDWATGKTTDKSDAPAGRAWKNDPQRNYSFYVGEHHGEIDSHHYSNSVCWGDDGRFYAKRGGDHFCVGAYDPATKTWKRLEVIKSAPSSKNWGGDASALMTSWKDLVIYHPGDTRDESSYIGVDVSAAAWTADKPGACKVEIGPFLPTKDKKNLLRYCDYPKINAAGICVVAGQIYDDAGGLNMALQATSLSDGKRLWAARFDDGGRGDFGAAAPAFWWHNNKANAGWSAYYFPIGRVSDYWRFIATEDLYLFYHGMQSQTLTAVDIRDGSAKWKRELGSDHPVMACHGDFLYVIGDRAQMKLDLRHGGEALWTRTNQFAGDAGYVMGGEDPVYRPMVLTDDTLWFVDGSSISDHHKLIGMKTSDGSIVQTIDLRALVAQNAGESLIAVNDLVALQGKLGVLIGIQSEKEPHAGERCNRIVYQDLYVFSKP